jgi:hypothetical protein
VAKFSCLPVAAGASQSCSRPLKPRGPRYLWASVEGCPCFLVGNRTEKDPWQPRPRLDPEADPAVRNPAGPMHPCLDLRTWHRPRDVVSAPVWTFKDPCREDGGSPLPTRSEQIRSRKSASGPQGLTTHGDDRSAAVRRRWGRRSKLNQADPRRQTTPRRSPPRPRAEARRAPQRRRRARRRAECGIHVDPDHMPARREPQLPLAGEQNIPGLMSLRGDQRVLMVGQSRPSAPGSPRARERSSSRQARPRRAQNPRGPGGFQAVGCDGWVRAANPGITASR